MILQTNSITKNLLNLYIFVVLAFLLTRADGYLNLAGILPIPRLAIVLILCTPIALVTPLVDRGGGTGSHRYWGTLYRLRLVLWPMNLFVAFAVAQSFRYHANWDRGGYSIFIYVFDICLLYLMLSIALGSFMKTMWRRVFRIALLLMASSIIWDLLNPGVFSSLTTRCAGFAVNANAGAFITLLLLSGSIDFDRRIDSLPYVIVGSVSVFITLSRAGIILLIVVFIFYLIRGNVVNSLIRSRTVSDYRRKAAVLVLVVIAITSVVYLVGQTKWADQLSSRRRMLRLIGQSSLVERDEPRVLLIYEYLELIEKKPLLGWGTGYSASRPVGPHNTYLQIWVDNGLIGLALYLWLLLALLTYFMAHRFKNGILVSVLLGLWGFFSHTLFAQQTVFYTIAIMLVVALMPSRERRGRRSNRELNALAQSEPVDPDTEAPIRRA